MSDSFAANRAAIARAGRPRSLSGNNRSTSAGVRASERSNRTMSTTSMPIPTITAPPAPSSLHGDGLLHRHGLRKVARLVDVEALRLRELHREHLQRDHREERLEERGRE